MNVERVVTEAVEAVFAEVRLLHDALLARTPLTWQAVADLRPEVEEILFRPGQIAIGAGVIVEPFTVPGHPLLLGWWQAENGATRPLDADLNPASLGFYDYQATAWFSVPRRTGQRHVVGPYVDVHGTERYVLTLTLPIRHDGGFLGVAGADVPLDRFERRVLGALDPDDAVIVGTAEGRVVLTTTADALPGTTVPVPTDARAVPSTPWFWWDPRDSSPL